MNDLAYNFRKLILFRKIDRKIASLNLSKSRIVSYLGWSLRPYDGSTYNAYWIKCFWRNVHSNILKIYGLPDQE